MLQQQEINLFRSFETPITSATLLTWKRYWILNLSYALFLMVIYFLNILSNHHDQSRLKADQIKLTEYQSEFKKMKNSFPQLFFSDNINDAVANFKKEMAAQQEIINIISKRIPFSSMLESLSRTIVSNVWLNSIMVEKNGDQVILKGESIGLNNLHHFIANLDEDNTFKHYVSILSHVDNKDINDPTTRLTFEITLDKHDH